MDPRDSAVNEHRNLGKETNVEERREFPRADHGDVTVHFKVLSDDGLLKDYRLGRSRNLSFGGIRFSTTVPVEEGSLLALELGVPELPHPVTALGTVVRKEPDAEGEGETVAVEFLWTGVEESVHARLKTLIRTQLLVEE